MMFVLGTLYKTNVDIPVWPITSNGINPLADWFPRGNVFSLIETDIDHFTIHTHLGVLRTSNLYQYTFFSEKFQCLETAE